ncbi:MAG: hypothetical protein K9N34_01050 [Candidatus Marinimicrobia bacterium]|nr:hypothetical protein [Candidatus Neomarinimicrobiota bacterium]MCF7841165.1 hypothetical protein [Candidatus Neomarinimicrobiota bacterium]MCF7901934.1 hypothetical protein [Candidatus Neomarinimicrobiota bacterium]
MKVNPQTIPSYHHDRRIQPDPVAPKHSQSEITAERRDLQPVQEKHLKADVRSSQDVLTHVEQTTLEALFGPRQKQTPEFYGNTKITAAYKGRLLDIKG